MPLSFQLSVESLNNYNLTQNRHWVISYVENEPFFIHVTFLMLWVLLLNVVADLSLNHFVKKLVNALHISIEVNICIWMIHWYALWEIDDCQFCSLFVCDQVELVVVSVNQPILSEVDHHCQGLFEDNFDLFLGSDSLNMAQRRAINQWHDNCMAIGINGSGGSEIVFMQKLHKKELSDGWKTWKVEPVVVGPVTNVLSVSFNAAERVTAESSEFKNDHFALRSNALVNIGFFADSYFRDDVFEDATLDESLEGQVVVAEVGQFVAVVWITKMVQFLPVCTTNLFLRSLTSTL